ncbi:GMP synthase-Glutamine amidotransferase [Nitrosomonas aestuarii]|uniref:GMP synthase-Glutamine amidotransferase n=1 Tax=Nitrosomonas aestuarii TaxID=52441 RepID=A0A1I4GHH2_9PROT|nr:type 1 glutamine amidotransferase [Nitrosomonas aestuarii]SFL29415.1 GMP synthase-Glutamine amidotransferase [Nitrosomonas aestuarii]
MKPVAIFRHLPIEGPGYFATFLDNNHIPWQLIKIDAGAEPPDSVDSYSGLVFMGGPMSVNDDLPWIESSLKLIKLAVAHDIPVLGHCLGGQMMAKALGGVVKQDPFKEMGWGKVKVPENPVARAWFDDLSEFETFHWHGESFSLPEGATCILSSLYCENQAFAMGIHLGMQCHVEMTERMVKDWSDVSFEEVIQLNVPSVQSPAEIETNLTERVTKLNTVADRLYTKWIAALK